MSRISASVKEVEIGGHEYTLKVTVSAIEQIERRYGDLQTAAQKCMKLGWGDAVFIIGKAAGLDKSRVEQLKERVIDEGLENVATIAAEYLGMIINPNGDQGADDSDDGTGEV